MFFIYIFIKKLDVMFGKVVLDYGGRLQALPPARL